MKSARTLLILGASGILVAAGFVRIDTGNILKALLPRQVYAIVGELNLSGATGSNLFPGGAWKSSGYVGIGTTNPSTELNVFGTVRIDDANVPFVLRETDQTLPAGLWRIPADGNTLRIDRNTAAAGDFSTYTTNFQIENDNDIDLAPSTGNVGIGTANPANKLAVNGDITSSGYVSITGASDSNGNLRFSAAHPYIYASGYIDMPGGLYVNGGTFYAQNQAQFRGGIHNDSAAYLTINGGTGSDTFFTGNVGIGENNNPVTGLMIQGANSLEGISMRNTNDSVTNGLYTMVSTGNGWQVRRNTAAAGDFSTFNTPLFIQYTDNVGIGTLSPGQKLDVNGYARAQYFYQSTPGGYAASINGTLSTNYIPKADASYRITESQIYDNGTTGVGIGTTSISQKLNVAGNILIANGTGSTLYVNNTSNYITTDSSARFVIQTGGDFWAHTNTNAVFTIDNDNNGSQNFIVINGTGTQVLNLDENGNLVVTGSCTSAGADCAVDIAEKHYSLVPAVPGMVMSVDRSGEATRAGTVRPSAVAHDPTVIGVVSTNPAITIKGSQVSLNPAGIQETAEPYQPSIALSGRVPVIVSSENGPVRKGDRLTTGTHSGTAAKQADAGMSLGTALEDFTPSQAACPTTSSVSSVPWPADDGTNPAHPCFRLADGTYIGKIMIFTNISWFDPNASLTDTGDLIIKGTTADDMKLIDTAQDDRQVSKIGAFAEAVAAKLQVGLLQVKTLVVNGVDMSKEVNNLKSQLKTQQQTIDSQKEQIKSLNDRVTQLEQQAN